MVGRGPVDSGRGLTVDSLRDAVRIVLGNPAYRERAGRLQSSIEAADGLNRAADLIEGAFGTGGREVPSEVDQHHRTGSDRPQSRGEAPRRRQVHRGTPGRRSETGADDGGRSQRVAPGRQFKAATGVLPHQYVVARRVGRAKQILQVGGDFCRGRSPRAGYSDQSQFSEVRIP